MFTALHRSDRVALHCFCSTPIVFISVLYYAAMIENPVQHVLSLFPPQHKEQFG